MELHPFCESARSRDRLVQSDGKKKFVDRRRPRYNLFVMLVGTRLLLACFFVGQSMAASVGTSRHNMRPALDACGTRSLQPVAVDCGTALSERSYNAAASLLFPRAIRLRRARPHDVDAAASI